MEEQENHSDLVNSLATKNIKLVQNNSRLLGEKRTRLKDSFNFCTPGKTRRRYSDVRLNSSDNLEALEFSSNLQGIKLKEVRVVLKDVGLNWRSNIRRKTQSKKEIVWEVEKILEKKRVDGELLYLIKWKDWSTEYNSWEPEANLVHCQDVLQAYENRTQRMLGRFKRKMKFYPGVESVQKYVERVRLKGETIDYIPVNEKELYRSIVAYLKNSDIREAQNVRENQNVRKIQDSILRIMLNSLRQKQLKSLENWEHMANSVTKGKPRISIENSVDLDELPGDLCYINDYLPGAGVIIPNDPPISCDCRKCGAYVNCCFNQGDCSFPYTSTGRVQVPPGTPIYECNKRCGCDKNCLNRVVQRGACINLCVFRTDNCRGWGLKTLQALKKGTFVTEFVGEVITNQEAEKRSREYDATGTTYLFDLDFNETGCLCPYTVDAKVYGNVSRFINHSCEPNLAVYGVWVDCLDPNLPRLAMFTTKDVAQQEELTFNYICKVSDNAENASGHHKELEQNLELNNLGSRMLCRCGTKSCRKYLF